MFRLLSISGILAILTMFTSGKPVSASDFAPLIDPETLVQRLADPNLVVLDVQPYEIYRQIHVKGAVHSNYGDWRKSDAQGLGKMLPDAAYLSVMIGNLGIGNDDAVIIVATGQSADDMASATRVYWTLKAIGHERVSILDGGLVAYAQDRSRPMASGDEKRPATPYKANLDDEYLVTARTVESMLGEGVAMVDNRSDMEYLGLVSGGPAERPGALPGAANIPFNWLLRPGSAQFHQPRELEQIFSSRGVNVDGAQVHYCHTGHRASLSWFVSHELLGNRGAKLYDGSTLEWSSSKDLPLEVHIPLGDATTSPDE